MKYKKEVICIFIGILIGMMVQNCLTIPSVKELETSKQIDVPTDDEGDIEVYTERTLPKRYTYTYTNTEEEKQPQQNIQPTYQYNEPKIVKEIVVVDEPKPVLRPAQPITHESKTVDVNGIRLKEKIEPNINVDLPKEEN